MMLDALLQFSAAQAVTATAVSTNTIDLSVARDMAPGTALHAVFAVDVAATAAGAATVTFEIISSAAADLSSPDVLASSGPIPKADLTAGRRPIGVALNPAALLATPIGRRYLGVRYTVGTGPLTAGSFSAYLTNHTAPGNQTYASGYTVF
jgi:hypothetical protein